MRGDVELPKIISISTYQPPFTLQQENAEELTKELFYAKIPKLERYLKVLKMVVSTHVIFVCHPNGIVRITPLKNVIIYILS